MVPCVGVTSVLARFPCFPGYISCFMFNQIWHWSYTFLYQISYVILECVAKKQPSLCILWLLHSMSYLQMYDTFMKTFNLGHQILVRFPIWKNLHNEELHNFYS
jgi:hypothetical protein